MQKNIIIFMLNYIMVAGIIDLTDKEGCEKATQM